MRRGTMTMRRLYERILAVRRAAFGRFPTRIHATPDFLIIGAQKAGTSSLYAWLTSHPDVLKAREKELHYFDERVYGQPIGSYWSDFPLRARMAWLRRRRGRTVVTGEATPMYLFDPRVPELVRRHVPDARLIVVLRDPVDRAISHYWMSFNRGNEDLPLAEALRAEADRVGDKMDELDPVAAADRQLRTSSYVARGQYAPQLERWLDAFPASQIKVIDFADLAAAPVRVYREVLEFLGVDPDAAPLPDLPARHIGTKQPTDPDTLEWLQRSFEASNRRLAELTGIVYGTADDEPNLATEPTENAS